MPDPDIYLTDDELAALSDEELAAYYDLLDQLEDEWRLNPKQEQAERLALQVDELMYGGAAGGGKTEWLLWHADRLSRKYRNHRTLALRRTFPQLKDSLIQRSLERFVDPKVCVYMVGEREWRYKETNSTIRFGFCDTDEDVRHYLSTQYDLIIFEELTEFTERQYTLLRSRNRTTARKRAEGITPHTISATNPGQIGHGWVKKRFVEATDYGDKIARAAIEYQGQTREQTVAFVPARVSDNPHIDPDYVFNLASLGDVERRQYLEGDWDVFEGQYFTEFSRERHVVLPYTVPLAFPRVRAIDYGFAKPFACLWIAWDYDGNAIVYRERYGPNYTATDQARLIVSASKITDDAGREADERIHRTVADPSIWTRQGHGLSIAQMYRDAGLLCTKAMNARIDGWSRVRDYLRGDGTASGGAKLTVFESCTNLIRTLPGLIFDKLRPEDLDTMGEDHAADALRYGLMSRGMRARLPKTVDSVQQDLAEDLARYVNERKKPGVHPVLGRISI